MPCKNEKQVSFKWYEQQNSNPHTTEVTEPKSRMSTNFIISLYELHFYSNYYCKQVFQSPLAL